MPGGEGPEIWNSTVVCSPNCRSWREGSTGWIFNCKTDPVNWLMLGFVLYDKLFVIWKIVSNYKMQRTVFIFCNDKKADLSVKWSALSIISLTSLEIISTEEVLSVEITYFSTKVGLSSVVKHINFINVNSLVKLTLIKWHI